MGYYILGFHCSESLINGTLVEIFLYHVGLSWCLKDQNEGYQMLVRYKNMKK
jgi:hypothetical protein